MDAKHEMNLRLEDRPCGCVLHPRSPLAGVFRRAMDFTCCVNVKTQNSFVSSPVVLALPSPASELGHLQAEHTTLLLDPHTPQARGRGWTQGFLRPLDSAQECKGRKGARPQMHGLEYYDTLGQFEAAGTGYHDGASAAFSPNPAPTVAPTPPWTQVRGAEVF